MGRSDVVGTVYLLHFDRPYHHARHYTGWTEDLPSRLERHARGEGAKLLAVVKAAGITWTLARTWEGKTRTFERHLKACGHGPRRCPICQERPKNA